MTSALIETSNVTAADVAVTIAIYVVTYAVVE